LEETNIKDFMITEENSIFEAMKRLDIVGKKILLVVRDGRLVATLTDGDVRRWILKKGDLAAKVKDIANYNPKYLRENEKNRAGRFLKDNSIEAVPILNEKDEIVSLVLWTDEEVGVQKKLDIPVVIMAGGQGTRLYPYTRILPKPLIPIGEIPITEHIMNRFLEYGCRKFFLVINYKKNMIKAYFNELKRDFDICYIEEEEPLGTGGGLSLLKGQINSTFIMTNCDILIEEDCQEIYEYHKNEKNLITMVCSLKNMQIPYGVIDIDEKGKLVNIREKPQRPFLVNTGMYIIESEVIEKMECDKPIDFPEIIKKYLKQGSKIGIYPISEDSWLDMGQFDEMEKMRRKLGYE